MGITPLIFSLSWGIVYKTVPLIISSVAVLGCRYLIVLRSALQDHPIFLFDEQFREEGAKYSHMLAVNFLSFPSSRTTSLFNSAQFLRLCDIYLWGNSFIIMFSIHLGWLLFTFCITSFVCSTSSLALVNLAEMLLTVFSGLTF